MSVFDRPRGPEDVLPADWRGNLDEPEMHDSPVGAPLAEKSRLLLPELGEPAEGLYAAPTSMGAVCLYWVGGGGGCVEDLEKNGGVMYMGIDPDDEGVGAPGAVVGLASDRVRSVVVSTADGEHEATLANNGFFYELPDSTQLMEVVDAVVVTHMDGSTTGIPVDWHHPPRP